MASSNTSTINPLELYTRNQLCSISGNMWSRPATALLIEMYRKLECLWKTTSIYYRNKKKRYEALQEIATAIAPFRPDTTVEDVKNKINGIRTQYVTEKNKVSLYAKKKPPMEYEPTLWCYDRLSFLAAYTSMKNRSPSEENTMNTITDGDDALTDEKRTFQVKIEDDDEAEIIETEDFTASENNEESESAQQSIHYINTEPCAKRAKVTTNKDANNSLENIFIQCTKPEFALMKPIRYKVAPSTNAELNEDCFSFQTADESFTCTENEDWIEVFGKFVSTQMKLITNKTLLIKLQHTIQSAIMETQLKQIELNKE